MYYYHSGAIEYYTPIYIYYVAINSSKPTVGFFPKCVSSERVKRGVNVLNSDDCFLNKKRGAYWVVSPSWTIDMILLTKVSIEIPNI